MAKFVLQLIYKMIFFRLTFLLLICLWPKYSGAQELKLYRLSNYSVEGEPSSGFVSLTDGFPFIDHPDSLIIANENLGNIDLDAVGNNSHTLDPVSRQRFLARLKINESDKLYVYRLISDTVYTLNVRDFALVAYLTPYEAQVPIPEVDYYIGFEIKNDLLATNEWRDYSNDLISIGKTCPFQTGQLKPMIWTKLETENFPSFHVVKNLPSELDGLQIRDIYECNMDGLRYYVMNYTQERRNTIRHLIIVDSLTNQLLYNKIFLVEDDHEVINLNLNKKELHSSSYQWAGKLFKNKPPIFFNFIEHWFGCPSLYYIGQEENVIRINCDNRH